MTSVMLDNDKQRKEDDIEITNEVTDSLEELEPTEVEEEVTDKVKKIQKRVKEIEAEKHAAVEELHRTKADYLNAKKHLEQQAASDKKRQLHRFIEDLLPLCDSFTVAMKNKEVWDNVDENWRKGVEGIYSQLQSVLQKHNVTADVPEGEDFDPNRHEALSETSVSDKAQHNTVVDVIQAGYYVTDDNKTVIRPARVVIGNYSDSKTD